MTEPQILALITIGLGLVTAVILVAMGEINHRRLMPITERLDESGATSYRTQHLMKTGEKLCPICLEAPVMDEREVCRYCITPAQLQIEEDLGMITPREIMMPAPETIPGVSNAFMPAYMMFPNLYREEE